MLRSGLRYASLFVLVFAARMAVVDRFGSDLPQGDQWYGVGEVLLVPFLQDQLGPRDLLRPHNEHPIALTRTLDLALFAIDGRWDARVGCTVNALLHAVLTCAVWAFGRRLLGGQFEIIWFVVVAALFALPVSWNNVIAAFHSQQLFLMGLSFIAVTLLLTSRANSLRWWMGTACAALALVSMASGLLAGAVVLATMALTVPPHQLLRHRATLIVSVIVVAVGAISQVHVPDHDGFRAQSFGYFVLSFGRQLQWPVKLIPGVVSFPLFPVLCWIPWLWLGIRLWTNRHRGAVSCGKVGRQHVLFAVGLWVLAQIAATAFVRGGDGPWPGSRFVDTIAAGVGVNVLALLVLLATARPASAAFHILRAAGGVAVALALVGMIVHAGSNWVNVLPERRAALGAAETSIRSFIEIGDVDVLTGIDVAHSDPNVLAHWLSIPELRSILPASVNPIGGRGPLGAAAFSLGRAAGLLFLAALLVAVAAFLPLSSATRTHNTRSRTASG